jgi:hypothetical protein
MKVYHSSDTAQVGTRLINDYKKNIELVRPFVIALKQNKDCFFNLCLSGQYIRAVLGKFNMKNMDTYFVKWATEGLFEYVRQNEFPGLPSRIESNYFFDSIESSKRLFKEDWGEADQEERDKIHLFEVELRDDNPSIFDMNWFDEAFEVIYELESTDQIDVAIKYARNYFGSNKSDDCRLEIVSNKEAVTVNDITENLK